MDYRIAKGFAKNRDGGKVVEVRMVAYEKDSEVTPDSELGVLLAMACNGSGYDLLKDGFSTDYIEKEEYNRRADMGSLAWIVDANQAS